MWPTQYKVMAVNHPSFVVLASVFTVLRSLHKSQMKEELKTTATVSAIKKI